jgi:threonine dehydrogenase-like Zn-dependent dehydrogenase
MHAICWWGAGDVRESLVPDPKILSSRDAIIRVTLSAICGSDLHLYNGYIPTMREGDVLGHEFMGIVEEVGSGVNNLRPGDRVVVPFTICCGACYFCEHGLWSLCDNSNPNARAAEKIYGFSGAGLFGYSHLFGGYAGGQAQYVRVPFADVGPLKVETDLPDEKLLFLSDVFPTGYMAAENCGIRPGDTIAVWGCGPVGLFAIRSAYLLGAERVIALDDVPARLVLASEKCGAEAIDVRHIDVVETLKELTGDRGPDACIDAVGMEAHGAGVAFLYDRIKQTTRLDTDRPHVLRQAIQACRKGGTVSIPGVYGGFIDKVPIGAAFSKSLTLKMGQTHTPRYMRLLLGKIESGEVDPSFVITHRVRMADVPKAYEALNKKRDHFVKVIFDPFESAEAAAKAVAKKERAEI